MRPGRNDWMKLYTSLLDHDGFAALDDSARMLIVALWLYTADSGQRVLPTDPAWLKRKIPMLNGTPDLQPLLTATDVYGNPTPFIAYCKPPKGKGDSGGGKSRSAVTGGTGGGKGKAVKAAGTRSAGAKTKKRKTKEISGTGVATRTRRAESIEEEKRREKREERRDETLTGFEREEEKEKKERVIQAPRGNSQSRTEQQQKKTEEPENPVSPIDSEDGSAEAVHIVPKPTRSAINRSTRYGNPQRIDSVIRERFPEHWQDPDCEAFGWEIVLALGYPDDREDPKIRSEWGAFAAWWYRVKASAPVIVIDDLRAMAIKKANYLRTKGRSARNKSAVWFHIMVGEMGHQNSASDRQARASPS